MTTITRYLPFTAMALVFVALLFGLGWLCTHYAFM